MLFLAVFCGFLAENQREHLVEHQREKQYIRSMVEDLKTDTANLNRLIRNFESKGSLLDSLIAGYEQAVRSYDKIWAGQLVRAYRGGFPDFYPTDRTIQQLKNAGGLRLIRNDAAAKGIISYDAASRDVKFEEEYLSANQDRFIEEVLKIWSVHKMMKDAGVRSWNGNTNMEIKGNYWITADPVAFEHLFNRLSEYNEAILQHKHDFMKLKEKAMALIVLLKNEYRLK